MAKDGINRKLVAILNADAVGYTRLMAEDEVATVQRLGGVKSGQMGGHTRYGSMPRRARMDSPGALPNNRFTPRALALAR